jgi:capsular exopolysaccharide synthesis family protein
MAVFGARTVVVDADLRHPRLHRAFRIDKERGLTNVLAGSSSVEDVLLTTGYKNLYAIPGGPCPPDPATLLDPARLRAVLSELTERLAFDAVLIDTPPMLVFADVFNLVPAVDGIVLIARALRTPKDAVRTAADSLRKIKAPLLGTLLNGEVAESGAGAYRYYRYRKNYLKRMAEEDGTGPAEGPELGLRAAGDRRNRN